MDIIERSLEDVAGLTGLYNAQVDGTPFCYPVSADEFARHASDCYHSGGTDWMHRQTMYVAVEDGLPVGFLHLATGRTGGEEADGAFGTIRFLAVPPGRRDAGQALLEAAHSRLAADGVDHVRAFWKATSYRCYQLAFGMLPTSWGHVVGLLGSNGYEPGVGEYFLSRPDLDTPTDVAPDAAVEIEATLTESDADLPGVTVRAQLSGRDVGECVCRSAGAYASAAAAQKVFYVDWLGVEEERQGKGWGRHLLLRALTEARALGYERVAIATGWRNYRGLSLYANYGFEAVGHSGEWRRELDAAAN